MNNNVDKTHYAHVPQYTAKQYPWFHVSSCERDTSKDACFLSGKDNCWAIRRSNGERDLRPCNECPEGPISSMTNCDKLHHQCVCSNFSP